MRRVALALVGTITGLVMLLSFKTHSTTSAAPPAATSNTEPNPATGDTTSSASSTPSSSTAAGPVGNSTTKTVTGDAADTRYGPVQVQITVTNGTLTAVTATEYPNTDPRDAQINSYAIPQLNSEVLASKSAKIDMVSGATYTSEGYVQSLQSALDKAGLS